MSKHVPRFFFHANVFTASAGLTDTKPSRRASLNRLRKAFRGRFAVVCDFPSRNWRREMLSLRGQSQPQYLM
jgi:hypothetical protein